MMIRLMGGTSGGQNWWELVDVSTGKVLLRSWNKEDIVRRVDCSGMCFTVSTAIY